MNRGKKTDQEEDNKVKLADSLHIQLSAVTYDCSHLQSAWDSGVFVLGDGTNQLRLDFTRP